jgi:AcrR family transcriptional regulator
MSETQTLSTARWTRRKEARPAEILDAAVTVFAEKGFAAARMDDIARRAGVTKGTIYLYFPSKEDVFKALISESIGQQIETVKKTMLAYEGSTRDLLRIVLTSMGTFLRTSDRAVLPKVMIAEAGNFPDLAKFYRANVIEKGVALFSAVIERGVARGEFRKLPAPHVARILVMPLLLIAIWRATFAKFDSEPFDFEGYVDTHVDLMLRGLAAEGEAP